MAVDTIKILIQGFAQQKENRRWNATSTTVLVKSAGKLVLIDPGCGPDNLKSALLKEGLRPEDIDIVVVTHSHYDHSRNGRLFDRDKVYSVSRLFPLRGTQPGTVLVPDTGIRVLHTPGHADKHISFLINTESGKYAVAGDVFWWEDGQEQKTDTQSLIDHRDPIAQNEDILKNSRKHLLDAADFIIPGHGKEFMVPK